MKPNLHRLTQQVQSWLLLFQRMQREGIPLTVMGPQRYQPLFQHYAKHLPFVYWHPQTDALPPLSHKQQGGFFLYWSPPTKKPNPTTMPQAPCLAPHPLKAHYTLDVPLQQSVLFFWFLDWWCTYASPTCA